MTNKKYTITLTVTLLTEQPVLDLQHLITKEVENALDDQYLADELSFLIPDFTGITVSEATLKEE